MCGIAIAEQITINWGKDNTIYTVSTCTVGGDVVLPQPPTKRGYIFKGWVAEYFNRGTYADWASVPQNKTGYAIDIYTQTTPLRGDYIIVEDASDYTGLLVKTHSRGSNDASIDVTILDTQETYNYLYSYVTSKTRIGYTDFYIQYAPWKFSADVPMIINNVIYPVGSDYSWSYNQYVIFVAKEANANPIGRYTGAWKFVYHGVWETDGIAGWKPAEQIVGE